MTTTDRLQVLKILRAFFRIAAFAFLLVSFSFTVDDTGNTWIMWRDASLLATSLAGLAVLMGGGWLFTALRIAVLTKGDEKTELPPAASVSAHPYNIWGPMPFRTRAGLALAVFLIFGTIGPVNALLTPPNQALRPMEIILATIASGGISACMIMFGNRKILLVIFLLACLAVLFEVGPIAEFLSGKAAPDRPFTGDVLKLTRSQIADYQGQRGVVAAGGIVLLSLGYVMFIYLLTREGRQRSRLEAEMSIARRIQKTLIPSSGISAGGARAAGVTVPASEVGGDYFDFLELPDRRLAVFAADVAGHGVGAGILGAMTKSAFRAHLVHDPSPASMLRFLNATLVELMEKNMFITAAYLLLDDERGSALIATAGHPALLHIRGDGSINDVRTPSLALGMDRNAAFTELTVPCRAGDVFLLYTDGLVEAVAGGGEQFGTERLKSMLAEQRQLAPAALCDALIQGAARFRGKGRATDDVTVVAVKVG